jgi:MFS family permease
VYPGALAAYVHENSGTMDEYAMWGALGIASFLAFSGIIAGARNIRWIFVFVGVFYGISLAFALKLKEEFGPRKELPLFPLSVILKNLPVYVAIFLTFTGITVTWTFWVLYLENLKISPYLIGVVTAVNPLFEFITLRFVARKIKFGTIAFGILVLSFAYPLFAFAKTVPQVLLLQAVSGFGWAFMFAGGLNEVINSGSEKGTATGLFQSSISLGNIAGPVIAGIISLFFKNVGAVFVFAGVIIFLGFAEIFIYNRILKKSVLR